MMNSQVEILDNPQNDFRLIKVGAGTSWTQLLKFCKENSLYGLEAFSGLPGTIGGAVFGNAGAHKVEMKDVLQDVTVMNLNTQSIETITIDLLRFDYRYSSFKDNLNLIIVECTLKVSIDSSKNTGDPIEFANFRKLNQPQGLTTGSFFKNPPNNYAGKLIEECGMKGFKLGSITTSPIHANFFINLGDATAKDVLSLKEAITAIVKEKKGIDLVPEVQIVNSDRLINLA
jgi:UDP-N-acetylmuramate dehydrogenase